MEPRISKYESGFPRISKYELGFPSPNCNIWFIEGRTMDFEMHFKIKRTT